VKIDNGTGGSRETSTGGSGSRPGRSAVGERGRESINFFAELKRRNVYKVAAAYAVVGWLVIQVTATIVPALHLPDGLTTAVVVLTLIGFPVALVIAWAFEMTPEGIKRTENVSPDEVIPQWSKKKFAALIIGIAVIAAGLLVFQILRSSRSTIIATADAKSIAVLPFVNMSGNKDDEYLGDGMTEELINVLAKVPGLRVPGRTSCFAFKGKSEEGIFHEVGERLHVGTVLEGSVRKAGDKLRVTAQLVNVADGYHLWSEDYDGDVKDILTFQSNVAQRVVEALQVKLGVEEARALAKKPTENPEAHRLYLLGRYEFGTYSEAGWTNSIRYYEQALKLDPN
jgi:TolB-like protein